MRLVVVGAAGRMGRTLIKAVAETQGCVLSAAIERPGSPAIGQDAAVLAGLPASGVLVTDDALPAFVEAEGVLDFTSPEASVAFAGLAAQARITHVVGTTGLEPGHLARLEAAARHAAIIRSGNMSLGVNLLAALVRKVAATLGTDWDIEIAEMHHRMKVDAPSGTAVLLGEAAAEGRGVDLAQARVAVRDGQVGARPAGAIGFAALRGGTVVGDHKVIFAGAGERLELAHVAEDRSLFAQGAVRAALWGRGRKPGLYSMADVLGLDKF
ncbi:4-hydroxy-tetrahydrodipicolinate reductase [Bosea sp. (in: a-proteobacteria)]|uniref:4-hydroxy-tetrahydrodipicolinate reductase n=1 Tax=Bosea sp. (in: a-proteobacteria) TaxID=1871050 RepID=UPI00086D477C|nr:4-hydroxy-tetrahydrodipicolinate reductase [Bosea sp. (in: a-proteobacteria)]MBN9440049.1 4-hydroxy-tetrahydrodipicolinate reductase [Bosea sp. (in: a-proteobacteria)]MBN9469303.1 4-hydroxy-tetrahydrodipicolinate reductase [Bosea sp. (in: a-proteobacteria)]ODT55299.1 MAG: 4-hydroxy-tetrahydrodipicolinate reductase [Methylobacterium sp. SCN 67-24]